MCPTAPLEKGVVAGIKRPLPLTDVSHLRSKCPQMSGSDVQFVASHVIADEHAPMIPFAKKGRSRHPAGLPCPTTSPQLIGMGMEKQESVAISGPILLMRPPDILILMQMVREGTTCMYYTGIDPFTTEVVYVAQGLRDRKLQWELLQTTWPVMGQRLIKNPCGQEPARLNGNKGKSESLARRTNSTQSNELEGAP